MYKWLLKNQGAEWMIYRDMIIVRVLLAMKVKLLKQAGAELCQAQQSFS